MVVNVSAVHGMVTRRSDQPRSGCDQRRGGGDRRPLVAADPARCHVRQPAPLPRPAGRSEEGIGDERLSLNEESCAQLQDRYVRSAQVGLDGPPQTHNKMRPLASGRGSFDVILKNLRHAVEYLTVTIRVNLDHRNIDDAEELFALLAAEGLREA